MDAHNNHCKLRRFFDEHFRTGTASATAPVVLLALICLATMAVFLNSACGSPEATILPPPPHVRPPTLTPTSTLTPTMLLPPVTLEEPDDGACLLCRSDVTFRWNYPYALQEDESYQLRVEGPDSAVVYRTRDDYTLGALLPGQYNWAVTVVRSQGPGQYVAVSEESEWRSFEILPPTPVVHTISPTSTVQGVPGLIVTVIGENFTHSVALTIGVPLRATFVNSSTITATVPATLEVGEHLVIIKDSAGEGMSTASFVVRKPVPSPTPQVLPTKRPMYPSPELIGADILGCNVTFRWSWPRELAEDEYYAVRYGIGSPGDSRAWVRETGYIARLEEPAKYTWEIAICQGEPETHICNQLAVSAQQTFEFKGCDGM